MKKMRRLLAAVRSRRRVQPQIGHLPTSGRRKSVHALVDVLAQASILATC